MQELNMAQLDLSNSNKILLKCIIFVESLLKGNLQREFCLKDF
jgi:hypothetical protein